MESIGFLFHTLDGVYWNEEACYVFDAREVDELEAATNELQRLCHLAVAHVIEHNLFDKLRIPADFARLAAASWEQRDPSLYGRFDLAYDGSHPPKMLEYNADTPTSLFEASVAQWYWLKDYDAAKDQFNSLHERLLTRWREIAAHQPDVSVTHFACIQESVEDYITTEYLRDTAEQAGLRTRAVNLRSIAFDTNNKQFVDSEDQTIARLFKLYPWEWLRQEELGPYLLAHSPRMIEPAWKMVLSNKGILAILWELFPEHPNLLPAYFSPEPLGSHYVQKPLLSREGANITMHQGSDTISSPGLYANTGWVYQGVCPLPVYNGNHAVIGSWVIGESSAGIGVREDDSPITLDSSRFVPHYFTEEQL